MTGWRASLALLSLAVFLAGAAAADQIEFSMQGRDLDTSGTLIGGPVAPGSWLITDATGTFNGQPISGVWSSANSGNIFAFNNMFYWPGPEMDYLGIVLQLDNGEMVNLCFDSGCGAADALTAIVWMPDSGYVFEQAERYQFHAPIPEPETMLLVGSGLLGTVLLARRRWSN